MQVVWILVATLMSEHGPENIYSWNATFSTLSDCEEFFDINKEYLITGAVSNKSDTEGDKMVTMMGCAMVKNEPGTEPELYQLRKVYVPNKG